MSTTWTAAIPQQDDEHHAPLRFERRGVDRWPTHGVANAFRLSGEKFGCIHELSILDWSHDGLGAICDSVIEPGTCVSLGFQAPGNPAKRGIVLRCTPCGKGYRVAIQFEARLAA